MLIMQPDKKRQPMRNQNELLGTVTVTYFLLSRRMESLTGIKRHKVKHVSIRQSLIFVASELCGHGVSLSV